MICLEYHHRTNLMSEWTEKCECCNHKMTIHGDDLSSHACDTVDFECVECGAVYNLGWYAEIDIYLKKQPPQDKPNE